MAASQYHFVTRWRVRSEVSVISDLLCAVEDLPRWWPSVYLEVKLISPGDADGIGKVLSLYTKGWLPYTLRWDLRVIESRKPHGFSLEAFGDFKGHGKWTFEQDGDWVNIVYDWRIEAEKPLLRNFSFLFRPVFSANHRWAMARGEESLRLELERRRARTEEERSRVPSPPGPSFRSRAAVPH